MEKPDPEKTEPQTSKRIVVYASDWGGVDLKELRDALSVEEKRKIDAAGNASIAASLVQAIPIFLLSLFTS